MPELRNAAGTGEKNRRVPGRSIDSRGKAITCIREASLFKASDLVLLDVSRFSSFADFFIICSGKSSRQVQGIADNLEDKLRAMEMRPIGVEGKQEGHWVLMDYGDVIIHIFYEPVRHFYDLESLWAEAPRLEWEEGPGGSPEESR